MLNAIRRRRSIRNFKPDRIPGDVLDKLLEALRLAPSAGNYQPYKFIIVQDEATKRKIAVACKWNPARPNGQEFIAEAPLVIIACGSERKAITRYYKGGKVHLIAGAALEEIDKDPIQYTNTMLMDLAIALDHLTLVAAAEGLGTCWIGGLDELEVKRLLSIPDDMRVLIVMPVGYPVSWPGARPRKPLERLICHDKYE
ncbi:MAG: nitroreductase family protein [Dehalococcoidales bacterium]|nr:nitroreductase family protein [Dehalococcoidales bacterium]